jgi:retron-type reverse transcriptase
MKRVGNLWPQITSFENLLLAAHKAQRGKRFRPNVLEFNYNLEPELIQLQTELLNQTYQPGEYRTFEIAEPKYRLISAAPYRDRIIHHALCNIIAPIFERSLIPDTYANRIGFGSHKALKRFTTFTRTSQYILQCDIQKYFPSINHTVLKTIIRRKIKCPQTLWLIDTLIDNSNPQEELPKSLIPNNFSPNDKRGLPIGNLTSQFFANFYLSGLDHFVKETLHIPKYLRYVDDFALFSDDKAQLADARTQIEQYLTSLDLKIHPIKSQLFETKQGATFVGFRILPHQTRVSNRNLYRARCRIKQLKTSYHRDEIPLTALQDSLISWTAHLHHGNTQHLQKQLFMSLGLTEIMEMG